MTHAIAGALLGWLALSGCAIIDGATGNADPGDAGNGNPQGQLCAGGLCYETAYNNGGLGGSDGGGYIYAAAGAVWGQSTPQLVLGTAGGRAYILDWQGDRFGFDAPPNTGRTGQLLDMAVGGFTRGPNAQHGIALLYDTTPELHIFWDPGLSEDVTLGERWEKVLAGRFLSSSQVNLVLVRGNEAIVVSALEPDLQFGPSNMLEVEHPGLPIDAAVADLDGDGLDDLAILWGSSWATYRSVGDGSFEKIGPFGAGPRLGSSVRASSSLWGFTGPREPGIALLRSETELMLSTPEGAQDTSGPLGDPASAIAVGDLTGNGSDDIVAMGSGVQGPTLLLPNGNSELEGRSLLEQPSSGSLVLADFNQDGKDDIVVASDVEVITYVSQ